MVMMRLLDVKRNKVDKEIIFIPYKINDELNNKQFILFRNVESIFDQVKCFNGSLFNGKLETNSDIDIKGQIKLGPFTAYYKDGKIHNDNGWGICFCHTMWFYWCQDGMPHRLDGPAIVSYRCADYFIEGKEYTFEQFWNKQKDTIHATKIMANILGQKNGQVIF